MGDTEETVKQVRVDYVATDHASETAKKIAQAYKEPAEAVNALKERFRDLKGEMLLMGAGSLGLGLGIGSLVDKAKDVNREFGGAQKAIASTLSTVLAWPKAIDPVDKYTRSMRLAVGVTQELDDKGADMSMGLGDMQQAYRTLAQATAPLHLSQKQLIDLTEKSAALSVRFGESAVTAADEVGHAMVTRVVRPVGDMGIFLRENVGGNLKHLNNAQVLSKFDKAMAGSVDQAHLMSQGVGGSIFRIRHEVDDIVRHLSAPIFKAVAVDIEHIYQKLKATNDSGRDLMDVYGQRILTVFHELESVSGLIFNHWRLIAGIWATSKVPKMFEGAAGIAGSLSRTESPLGGLMGLKSLFGGAGDASHGIKELADASKMSAKEIRDFVKPGGQGLGGFLGAVGPAVQGLGGIASAAVLAAEALHGVYAEWQSRKQKATDLTPFFKEMSEVVRTQSYLKKHETSLSSGTMEEGRQAAEAHAGYAASFLKQQGLLDHGVMSMERFNQVMDSMPDDLRKSVLSMLPSAGLGEATSSGTLGSYIAEVFRKSYHAASEAGSPDDTGRRTTGKTFNFFGPVNINQKFEDNDPDRVAVRLKDDLENYTNRRTQSALSGVGGF